jgi:Carboxypeptidase regulatory-like domain/TonB-dependent Receptor Plug Domain
MKHSYLCSGLLTALLATAAGAQRAELARPSAGATVSGVVFDSLGGRPLSEALVQLVNADSLSGAAPTSVTDSLGRFAFEGVRAGRYLLGFIHPLLDSIGVEPKPREVTVDGVRNLQLDLATPSARTLRVGLCGAAAVADSDALIIGVVRHARDRQPVDSVVVVAQWIEMVLERGGLSRSKASRQVRTQETGWFAVCGAPSGGTILLTATRGADSTEALELELPGDGFLRRDLYFGAARTASRDTRDAPDSLASAPRLVGDGRLSGTVVARTGSRPLAGARVGILNGPQTRTDERGAWTLTGIPTGTRTLEVRAIAHYPVTQPVDVVDGAPPIRIAMMTLQSVLDTVRITANRMGSNNLIEFMKRRRQSGTGRFLTSEEIAQRRPVFTADLFRTIPGVYVDRDRNGEEILTMRGNATGRCRPSIFVNGMSMRGMSAGEINGFVRPNELVGVEVYSAAGAPAQFSEMNGCGSIVFWSR